jgi:hypothetical protein
MNLSELLNSLPPEYQAQITITINHRPDPHRAALTAQPKQHQPSKPAPPATNPTPPAPFIDGDQSPATMAAVLAAEGVAPAIAAQFSHRDPERIRAVIRHYHTLRAAGKADGPGIIVATLRNGWKLPKAATQQKPTDV